MSEGSEEPCSKPLVLLAEDDERLAALRAISLEQMGLDVVVSNNLGEALSTLETGPELDAVLIDIKLSDEPGDKGGLALGKAIRERYGDIPMVAYSAFYADELLDEVSPLFDRYYTKGGSRVAEIEEGLKEIRELAREARRRREK
ncbi:MAG TPA: response regulator [Solirubrobacterales bacterium]